MLKLLIFTIMLSSSGISAHSSNEAISQKSQITLDAEDEDNQSFEDDIANLEDDDPLEPLNRSIFLFNQLLDGFLIKPIALGVSYTVPENGQKSIRHFIDNLFLPLCFVNNILQGEIEESMTTLFRFIINSTIGFLGFFDVAEELGLHKKMTTLKETFEKWGMESGPYLVLPIFGPSTFRDALGKVGDLYLNPLYYIADNHHRAHNHYKQQLYWLRALYALDGIMVRTQYLKALDDLEKSSFDFYIAMRSMYLQKSRPSS